MTVETAETFLQEKRSTAVLDSAKQNLASSFVNAFVNAGFCKEFFARGRVIASQTEKRECC